jgi:hypothetical protein
MLERWVRDSHCDSSRLVALAGDEFASDSFAQWSSAEFIFRIGAKPDVCRSGLEHSLSIGLHS